MRDHSDDTTLVPDLDRCVKCGLCLPECPTYRLAVDENESPRGRLSLIDGFLNGRLEADAALLHHIDSCLSCRRCERVCPSQVPFGHLIDAARARLPHGTTTLLTRPRVQRFASALGRRLPTALSRPLKTLHDVHRGIRALNTSGPAPSTGVHRSAIDATRGRVGLFAGCTGSTLQPSALRAAVRLIQQIGFDVEVPRETCCGALATHAGDSESAARAERQTRDAFDSDIDCVVSIASGCGIQLDSYAPRYSHRDICRFLLEEGEWDGRFSELTASVALHVPCSVENVYRGADWARRLLARIPGIELIEIGEPGICCGAAGEHMLRHHERAARLREPLLRALAGVDADILLTSNVGCALHLAAGLRKQGRAIEVLHPIELLARQLR